MTEKLNRIPVPVIIIGVIAVLGGVGFWISKQVQSQNGSYTVPMDRTKYMARMKEQAAAGQYSAQGSPGQRRGRPGAGGQGAQQGGQAGGGYGSYGQGRMGR
jgi:hypothetical protein